MTRGVELWLCVRNCLLPVSNEDKFENASFLTQMMFKLLSVLAAIVGVTVAQSNNCNCIFTPLK